MVLVGLLMGVGSCRSSQAVGGWDCFRLSPGMVALIEKVTNEIEAERLARDGGAGDDVRYDVTLSGRIELHDFWYLPSHHHVVDQATLDAVTAPEESLTTVR